MTKKQTVAKAAVYQIALDRAYEAARQAQSTMHENTRAFNCGFAWVVVHDLSFMNWARRAAKANLAVNNREAARLYGSKHYSTGWCFWCPGSAPVQDVDIHAAGAKAFSDSLAHSLQIRCEMGSRLD